MIIKHWNREMIDAIPKEEEEIFEANSGVDEEWYSGECHKDVLEYIAFGDNPEKEKQ